jgi:ATP-dependent protease ClpP protease subunit
MCDEMQTEKLNFEKDGNFYIYGDIDESIPENIIAPLISAISQKKNEKDNPKINVFLSSNGGDLHYAFELISTFDMARDLGVTINTIVNSQVCSAASLIAVCGHKRIARPWSSHLIHFSKQWDFSHNPEMSERNLDYTIFINTEMVKIYKQKTKLKNIEKKMIADNFMVNGERPRKARLSRCNY